MAKLVAGSSVLRYRPAPMPEIPAPTTSTSRCSTGVCGVVTRPTLRAGHRLRQRTVHQDARPAVQGAAHWPDVSPRVRELFRRGAEVALDPRDDWIEELHTAALGGPRMRPVAEDPVLAAATRRVNLANLPHWAAANVQHPGRLVPANAGAETLETARDLVRRGPGAGAPDGYPGPPGGRRRRGVGIRL